MVKNQHKINLTAAACRAIVLFKENDYTLENQHLRISIKGKGCDGFTYQLGFDLPHQKDLVLDYHYHDSHFYILLDPFAAFYVKNALVDYQLLEDRSEGFVLENFDQYLYHGKFYKDKSLTPNF